jgi:hypothetical protein
MMGRPERIVHVAIFAAIATGGARFPQDRLAVAGGRSENGRSVDLDATDVGYRPILLIH